MSRSTFLRLCSRAPRIEITWRLPALGPLAEPLVVFSLLFIRKGPVSPRVMRRRDILWLTLALATCPEHSENSQDLPGRGGCNPRLFAGPARSDDSYCQISRSGPETTRAGIRPALGVRFNRLRGTLRNIGRLSRVCRQPN